MPPEFPIWPSDLRIVRLSCPRHNEFATRADPLTPSEKASSRETGFEEMPGNVPAADFWPGTTSGCAVTRPRSAAALQNYHFYEGAAGSDASQNEPYSAS
jgi:hypothetical protein